MRTFWLKLLISIAAGVLIIVHIIWPNLTIDVITLGLLVVLILPWLTSIIKSAEFPGGWKIEFQDIQSAGAKVAEDNTIIIQAESDSRPSYIDISTTDPNLALVSLRIEIEKRLRTLAKQYQIKENRPMGVLFNDLRKVGVLSDPSVSGLQELIMAGNQAAHGARVDSAVASWAFDFGPQILAVLDAKLNKDK